MSFGTLGNQSGNNDVHNVKPTIRTILWPLPNELSIKYQEHILGKIDLARDSRHAQKAQHYVMEFSQL